MPSLFISPWSGCMYWLQRVNYSSGIHVYFHPENSRQVFMVKENKKAWVHGETSRIHRTLLQCIILLHNFDIFTSGWI